MRKYEQARVLGGGSSINGQLANRGAPSDYDEWEARGAEGWNWNAVLPYFKKVERDMDFDGPWHGKDGRIPVRRIFPDMWNGHAKAVAKAFEGAGFPYVQDQNGEFKDGYFPITISNLYDRRVSAAIGYLDPGTRLRDNLTISTRTEVQGLLFEGTRCVGVKALVDGKETEFRVNSGGGEVVVSSGAIHSPAHLLRAGIGPAGDLRDLGIEVVSNVPGVGQRLMDHPSISVSSFIKPDGAAQRPDPAPYPAGVALFVGDRWRPRGRHVRRRGQQIGLARGRRADCLAAGRRLQNLLGNRPSQARLARLAG